MIYAVIFEQGPSSVGASVPDLPGCVAIGETVEEARMLITEAIEGHVEVLRELGQFIPDPSTMAEMVEVV